MRRSLLATLAFLLLPLLSGAPALCAPPQTVIVQVRQSQVRSSPSFLGKVLLEPVYGDRLEPVGEQGGWYRVIVPGRDVAGWIHGSAVTQKQIPLKAGGKDAPTGASAGELALASKGFNSDVEAEFRNAHRELDFRTIDRMEAVSFSPRQLSDFLQEGGVAPGKEAAR